MCRTCDANQSYDNCFLFVLYLLDKLFSSKTKFALVFCNNWHTYDEIYQMFPNLSKSVYGSLANKFESL